MSDELVTLTIDDKEVQVAPGTLIVDAAAAVNVEIPSSAATPSWTRWPAAACAWWKSPARAA
ncbi:MAG: (2Fe-2S)-binding protein [Caldilineaceae bacterium]|nr:(2Fe-2S)-binding protein [Caldilineaceae bacterium]